MAINIPKSRHQEAVEMVKNAYNNSLNFQRPLFINFNEYYQIYRSVREEGKQNYAGRAKLFIPYVFSTIETIIPRLIGEKPKIEAVPREPDDIKNAHINSQLFNYEWDIMGMKEKLKYWVKQCLIYGVGIMKVYWEYNEMTKKDQPKSELVDLFDFFIDPDASTMDDARYVIQRFERNINVLKKNKNYTVPKTLEARVQEDSYKVQRDAVLGLTRPKDKDNKKVEGLEYWGLFDLEGKGKEVPCIITVGNQDALLRCEKNPFDHQDKPFIALHDTQIPFSFWSIGEVEMLKSLAYELNDVRNQRMDNVTIILNRMWKVNKNADVDEEDLVSQAGQIVHCGDMNGVEPLETPDVTTSAYNEESMIKSDMQMVSGVTDYSRGQGDKNSSDSIGNQTATGIMLLQEAGNARFKYKLDNIEDSLIRLGKQLLSLNQQYMDKKMKIRIVGPTGVMWVDMSPEELKGDFDVAVAAGSTQPMNKSVRRAEARELLQAVVPLAPLAMQLGFDLKYFIKYLLETYDLTNIEEAFPEQQIPPELAGLVGQGGGAIQSPLNTPGIPQVGGMEPASPTTNAQNSLAGATIATAGGFQR